MTTLAMTMQLHVPFEALSAQITVEQSSGKMTSLDVYDQRVFTTEMRITDVTDELLRDNGLTGNRPTEIIEHALLIASLNQPITECHHQYKMYRLQFLLNSTFKQLLLGPSCTCPYTQSGHKHMLTVNAL
jgi:hypothetical protein